MAHRTRRYLWRALIINTVLLLSAAGGIAASSEARAGTLDDIRARGILTVGTKADYQPFGFRNEAGQIVGFEPDLAAEIAKALGVSLKLVPVVATTRVELLNSGDIDLVIATMNDTPERRKQVDFVEPSYYASGVNVLAPKAAHLHVLAAIARRAGLQCRRLVLSARAKRALRPRPAHFQGHNPSLRRGQEGRVRRDLRRCGDHRPIAETGMAGLRNAAALIAGPALGHRGQAGKQGAGRVCRRHGQEMAHRRPY
jgi:hypothetical protein